MMSVYTLKNINFMNKSQFTNITPSDDEIYAVETALDGSEITDKDLFRANINAPCKPTRVIEQSSVDTQVGDILGININIGSPTFTVPPGGTWFCYYYNNNAGQTLISAPTVAIVAGGTTLTLSGTGYLYGFAWRIA